MIYYSIRHEAEVVPHGCSGTGVPQGCSGTCRVAVMMSPNHVTKYFRKAKEHRVQWQLNRSYRLTCTLGRIAAQFDQHGNCATVTVDTVVLGKLQAACI